MCFAKLGSTRFGIEDVKGLCELSMYIAVLRPIGKCLVPVPPEPVSMDL